MNFNVIENFQFFRESPENISFENLNFKKFVKTHADRKWAWLPIGEKILTQIVQGTRVIDELKLPVQIKSFSVFAWSHTQTCKSFWRILRCCGSRSTMSKCVQFEVLFCSHTNIDSYLLIWIDGGKCSLSDLTDYTTVVFTNFRIVRKIHKSNEWSTTLISNFKTAMIWRVFSDDTKNMYANFKKYSKIRQNYQCDLHLSLDIDDNDRHASVILWICVAKDFDEALDPDALNCFHWGIFHRSTCPEWWRQKSSKPPIRLQSREPKHPQPWFRIMDSPDFGIRMKMAIFFLFISRLQRACRVLASF